jgi:hypothetical protein
MMDDILGPSLADRHLERIEHEFGAQMVGHGPAHNTAAPGIQHDREIEKACHRWHEREILSANSGGQPAWRAIHEPASGTDWRDPY